MKVEPFVAHLPRPVTTSQGVLHERRGFFVSLGDGDGDGDGDGAARGEATPIPWFGTETLEVCERVLRRRGDDDAFAPCARHALEQAALGARGDVAAQLGARVGVVPVDDVDSCALGRDDVDDVLALVAGGATLVKIKIGEAELARHFVRRLRARVPASTVRLRLDANGGLDELSARWLCRSLRPEDGVELFEQPVAADNVEGLCALAADFPITVCADEALVDPERRKALLRAREPIGFIWKPQAVGGAGVVVDAVNALPDRVHVVTGFFDTAVGLGHARACARVVDAITGVRRAHGLSVQAMIDP